MSRAAECPPTDAPRRSWIAAQDAAIQRRSGMLRAFCARGRGRTGTSRAIKACVAVVRQRSEARYYRSFEALRHRIVCRILQAFWHAGIALPNLKSVWPSAAGLQRRLEQQSLRDRLLLHASSRVDRTRRATGRRNARPPPIARPRPTSRGGRLPYDSAETRRDR